MTKCKCVLQKAGKLHITVKVITILSGHNLFVCHLADAFVKSDVHGREQSGYEQ